MNAGKEEAIFDWHSRLFVRKSMRMRKNNWTNVVDCGRESYTKGVGMSP